MKPIIYQVEQENQQNFMTLTELSALLKELELNKSVRITKRL